MCFHQALHIDDPLTSKACFQCFLISYGNDNKMIRLVCMNSYFFFLLEETWGLGATLKEIDILFISIVIYHMVHCTFIVMYWDQNDNF
jgi:hypothetical protein